MKRMFIVALVAALVVGLAVPASAADNPTWKSAFITLFSSAVDTADIPDGYNYMAVFYYPVKLSSATSAETIRIFYSKTPVISIGDNFYWSTGANVPYSVVMTGLSTYYIAYPNRYFLLLSSSRNGASANSSWLGYYISSVSTAHFEGMYDVGVTEPWIYDIEVPLPDSSALQALIMEALSKNESNYTADSWQQLNAALTTAQNLLASSYYTQAQVNEALTKLNNAMNSLVLRPSTSGLVDLLNTAKSIQNNNYTDASWSNLQAAIQEAETLLSSGSYTQEAVDGMLGRLNNAMSALAVAIDTSRLVSLISTAKAIQNDNYTDESWSALQNAIRSSQDILDYGGYTQASVDAMVNNLQKYINGLKKNAAVVNPPYEFPEVPPMQPDAEGHRYLRDGIRFADLIPAQDAIMENVEWAISNGKILFGVLLLIYLTPRILRAAVGFDFESKYVDLNYPSSKSRHYRPLPKLKEEPENNHFMLGDGSDNDKF